MRRPRLVFAVVINTLPLLRSQQPEGPEFEVVSIKLGAFRSWPDGETTAWSLRGA